MSFFRFEILHTSTKSMARVGRIHTPHGIIDTPGFVAVGTNGTIKALDNEMVSQIGVQLMFCNTYHMLLQPGPNIVQEAGGIHTFINRKMPIITDSGGFQVFSLAYGSVADELKSKGKKKTDGSVLKITEEGVLFRSYRDGRKILLTPETSIAAQKALGADIIIPFDELPPYHMPKDSLKKSLERTHRWEKRSLDEHLKNVNNQAMFAVIHGGIEKDLREESCKYLSSLPFDGFALGGSLGKTKKEMIEMLSEAMPKLPLSPPKHLLGIGDIESIEKSIPLGLDTFDSSYPTRAARHAMVLTQNGAIKVDQGKYANSHYAIEASCECHTCKNYTLSYLHHLFKAKEITALILATIHNLAFMVKLMKYYQKEILEDRI